MIWRFTIWQDNLYKLETRFIITPLLISNSKREETGKPLNVYFSSKFLRKMRYRHAYRRNENHISVFISIFYHFFIWKKLEKELRVSLRLFHGKYLPAVTVTGRTEKFDIILYRRVNCCALFLHGKVAVFVVLSDRLRQSNFSPKFKSNKNTNVRM